MASDALRKPWVVAVLGFLVVFLGAVLIFVVVRYTRKPASVSQGTQTSVSSVSDNKLAARDGKTEQLTLVSQQANTPFTVEIASTEASRQRGLSGRDGLAPNSGMLFMFGEAGYDCFWMKDMKFDIDMLWFDEYQNLVHIQEDASKSTYPNNFCPQTPASYVLEVPAGTAKQLGLQPGDRFTTP